MEQKKLNGKGVRCLVLAGGEVNDYRALAGLLSPDDFVICADSGLFHCERLGLTPHLMVGDFDSLGGALPPGVPVVELNPEKDYTDTALALEQALERGYRHIVLAGVLGGRLDHTLANLQSLADLSRKGVDAWATDGVTQIWAITDGSLVLEPRVHHYFSLFAVGEACRGVNIRGARYLLQDFTLGPMDPRAVSNEFLEGPAEISVEKGTLLITCLPMDRQGQ